ncbi:hypothetical protein [Cohnella boryungensis]|uniref:Uncharacterized protein n=1 Tax=Cohnella boryungensis TaxID=768479 RepID=A0ABV8SK22_9BACL
MKRSAGKYGWRQIAAALTAVWLLGSCASSVYADDKIAREPELSIIVRSSSSSMLFSRLEIDSPSLLRELRAARAETAGRTPFFPDIEVEWRPDSRSRVYRLDHTGHLLSPETNHRLPLPNSAAARMLAYARILRNRHYGKLVPWSEARRLVARKSIFTLTDLESGLSFRVQRRAGSSHADVQPLSKEDSATMKRIYGGRWSWQRRAVLVGTASHRLAASMNGMPHGGDGIPDNGFNGHFCVHFLDSTSHRSETPDWGHQLRVHQAAGSLSRYFSSSPPLTLALSFVEALNSKDTDMLALLREQAPQASFQALDSFLNELESIAVRGKREARPDAPSSQEDERLSAEIELPVRIRRIEGRSVDAKLRFSFEKSSIGSSWRLIGVSSNVPGISF